MFHTIGEVAGEIWRVLKDEEPLNVFATASKSKLPQTMVCVGSGCLAREDKLLVTQTK